MKETMAFQMYSNQIWQSWKEAMAFHMYLLSSDIAHNEFHYYCEYHVNETVSVQLTLAVKRRLESNSHISQLAH